MDPRLGCFRGIGYYIPPRGCSESAAPTLSLEKYHMTKTKSRELFKILRSFSVVMWSKLIKNDHKGGWRGELPERLFEKLEDEIRELDDAISRYRADPSITRTVKTEKLARQIALEAADVANYAMMIADVVGGFRII
jgi:hypothetical protein